MKEEGHQEKQEGKEWRVAGMEGRVRQGSAGYSRVRWGTQGRGTGEGQPGDLFKLDTCNTKKT